ncbi:hypothetical protein [Paenibacillus xylaniclasticus]|uniref:hypothetical protein n=1 Tax=Paenibacillus xylaniclasticus TaxID=588083 RepID=UPI000FD7A8C4|nr:MULTISPECIES: hypothetical protein [Paenibacillus]GFN30454.1 hypothetical protein PCURB6_07140 [Paenibacillus curdlanolyticus]
MRSALLISMLGAALFLSGCANNSSSTTAAPNSALNSAESSIQPEASDLTEGSLQSPTVEPEAEQLDDHALQPIEAGKILEDQYYSIKPISNDSRVQLRDDEDTVVNTLGSPIEETAPKKLGEGADTFSEMYQKTVSYEGLTMQFLGMDQDKLWLAGMKMDGDQYQTSEGIKVGDHLQSLLDAYPNISHKVDMVIEEKPNARVYSFWQDDLGFIAEFIVNDQDIVEEIQMYYLFD